MTGGTGYVATAPGRGLDRSWFSPGGARASFGAPVTTRSGFACLVLFPPGHALHVSSREATPGDQEVVVTPEGGTLVLSAPVEPLRVPVLFRNGCPIRLASLARAAGVVATDRGATLEVVSPLVEAGPWSLCLVTPGQLESHAGGEPDFPLCDHGVLAVGGRLDLSLLGLEPAPRP